MRALAAVAWLILVFSLTRLAALAVTDVMYRTDLSKGRRAWWLVAILALPGLGAAMYECWVPLSDVDAGDDRTLESPHAGDASRRPRA